MPFRPLYPNGWPATTQAALYWNRKRRLARIAAAPGGTTTETESSESRGSELVGIAFVAGISRYGNASGVRDNALVRFANIDVAQGTVIDSATLSFTTVNNSGSGGGSVVITARDIDDAPALAAGSESWAVTSASVSDTYAANTAHNVDVTAIVQEILDRGGWVADNAMAFRWRTPSIPAQPNATNMVTTSFELEIVY